MPKFNQLFSVGFFLLFFGLLFGPLFVNNLVAAPMDTLVGAYFPWLEYKWGYPVGVPVKNGLISDVFNTFFNWKHIGMSQFFQGIIPVWNPYEFLGSPLLATFHSALLHPFNFLFLLPIPWGWNLFTSFSTVAAAFSMYLFLRSYKFHLGAKLFGSIVFALGGPMTTWSEFGTAVLAMAVLPLLFLFVRTRRFLYIPPAVLCLILAGNVQIVTYSLPLVLIYSLISLGLRQTLLVGLLVGTGLLLSAVQLLPTLAMYGVSMRSDEQYSSYFNYGLQPAGQLIRLLTPDIFGHPVTGNYQNPYSYHEYTGYFGVIAFMLALAAIITSFSKQRFTHQRFFALLAMSSVFLAVDNPFTQFLFSRELPLLTYSSASRIFFLLVFSAAFLCAQYLSRPQINRRLILILSFACMSLIALVLAGSAGDRINIALKNSLLPLSSIFLLCFSVFLPRRAVSWLLLAIVCLDLFRFYTKYNPFVPSRLVYPDTQATRYLQSRPDKAVISISENSLPENTWAWYRIRSFEGYNPLHLESFNRFAQVANSKKYFNSPSRYAKIETPNFDLLRLSNVGLYVISVEQKEDYGVRQHQLVYAGEGLEIYEDTQALPQRYTLPRSGVVTDEVEMASLLESPDFDPQTALVYTPVPPDHYLAIFTQAFAPGWTASANNEKLASVPVFGALTGVVTPSDVSLEDIELRYTAPGVVMGGIFSLAGIVVYLLLLRYRFKLQAKSYIIR